MNNKGLSIFTLFFWIVIIIIIWFTFLGSLLNQAGETAVSNGNLTGIEAFFYSNLNLFIIAIPVFLFILAGVYSSGVVSR